MADTAPAHSPTAPASRAEPAADAIEKRLIWPWQVAGREWKRVLKVVFSEISEDRLSIIAAAMAFYSMLALFPGLIALVSLFGLVAEAESVEAGVSYLTGLLPEDGRKLLSEQLHALVTTPESKLSLGFGISLLTALWSASNGVDSLVDAMNVAYHKAEKRNWIKRRLMSMLMTLGLIVLAVVAITLVAIIPSLVGWLGQRIDVLRLLDVLRWPTLALVGCSGLFCLYRYAPCRKRPLRVDISGAIVATLLFLVVSSLFSLYVSEFAAYSKTYGAVGSVVALLFWFYYSSFVVLIGAELSATLEGEKRKAPPPSETPSAPGPVGESSLPG